MFYIIIILIIIIIIITRGQKGQNYQFTTALNKIQTQHTRNVNDNNLCKFLK